MNGMPAWEEATKEKLICAHCGDHCEDSTIASEENIFCCLGCRTVFEILHENGLDAYYRIESQPGVTLKHNRGKDYFGFLENPLVRRKLLSFESTELSKVNLYIPSIHCSSCIWLLENLFQLHKGVSKSEVNFPKKELYIDFNPSRISLRELVELLSSLGYEPELSLDDTFDANKKADRSNRILLTKIGVAGFCFGNIMLLSFPEYLGLEHLVEVDFSKFFSLANILFALPVVFYSAWDYYDAAYRGLRHNSMSIDVPIAIGILTLFLRSIYEVASQTGPGYFDSLSGLVFFLLIGKWFQNRTYASLLFDRNYKSYFPIAVTRILGNKTESIQIEDLKEDDIILIRNGELIPSDSELLSEEAYIDNSFVTGESKPIVMVKGDYIYAGGRQKGSAIKLLVRKEVSQSYLTQLWNDEAFSKNKVLGRKVLVDKISKYFTWIVLSIAITSSLFWLVYDPSKVINVFTAVLIVACPCALALSTPFAVGTALRILGRNGCYLKNGEIVEEIRTIDHIVFDKTGTITYNNEGGTKFVGTLGENEALLANSLARNSYHPLSRRIVEFLNSNIKSIQNPEVMDFMEYSGKGLRGVVDGKNVLLGSAEFVRNKADFNEEISSSRVYLSIDDQIKGFFELTNHYRQGLKEIVDRLNLEIDISLLSGDNASEQGYLESVFPSKSILRFEQSAYDKLEFVKGLQLENVNVMMVGDGLNDAGALAQANIGVAVTEDVNNFTPASDVILSGRAFQLLPQIIKISSATVSVIIISFIISFLYNVVGIGFAISGNLTPIFAAVLMPLSSISVVLFTSLSVNWRATRLGFK